MPPDPLSPTARYVPDGITRIYWVPTIADTSAPTREELDDATAVDLTGEIADVVGWHISAERRPIQPVGERFRSELDGSLEVDDARLVLYADIDGADVTQVIDVGDDGHVVFLHGGDAEGNPMDVWPVRLAARNRVIRIGGEPTVLDHQFVVTRAPAQNVPVPGVS